MPEEETKTLNPSPSVRKPFYGIVAAVFAALILNDVLSAEEIGDILDSATEVVGLLSSLLALRNVPSKSL